MKVIITIALIIGLMIFAGWINVASDEGTATATFDKTEMKADTDKAVQKTKELAHDAGELLNKASDKVKAKDEELPPEEMPAEEPNQTQSP